MPTSITIATFNCENLFKRYKFSSKLADAKKNDAVENGFIIDKTIFETSGLLWLTPRHKIPSVKTNANAAT